MIGSPIILLIFSKQKNYTLSGKQKLYPKRPQ